MSGRSRTYLLVGCLVLLALVVAGVGVWLVHHPELIVGVAVLLLFVAAFRGGTSATTGPGVPADPEQEKRTARRLASRSADSIIEAYEAGEISLERRDELLKHIYHAPTDGPARPGPGRRP